MPALLQQWAEVTPGALGLQWLLFVASKVSTLYLVGFGFWFLERLRPAQPESRFFKGDFRTELCYPLFNATVSTPVFTLLLVVVTLHVLEPFVPHEVLAPDVLALPFAVQVLVALLLSDLAVYAEHRFLAHRALWRFHAMHHMPAEVSWITTLRVHPVNAMTIAAAAAGMRWVLGFEGQAIVVATWISSALAFWEHSNLDVALPRPWCWLVVTPRYHRWHHASEPEAADKNFSLIFPFIDVLFGTYYCPDRLPRSYGVVPAAAPAGAIPDHFLGQLGYPFRRTLAHARALLRLRSAGVPS
jgi:sterol desaturase/sphingolipid hydroxylase (fatty acid hydroxylase superfamily)